jgi:hypothetical protein
VSFVRAAIEHQKRAARAEHTSSSVPRLVASA